MKAMGSRTSKPLLGARDGLGKPISPHAGIFPLLKELEPGRLKVTGTGFYVTRYGLFLTARHVLEDVVGPDTRPTHTMFALHYPEAENAVHLRRVLRFSRSNRADIALGELDNFMEQFPDNPLMNRVGKLSTRWPGVGEELITFAYPENELLDFEYFKKAGEVPCLAGNYFRGQVITLVGADERPFLPYPHIETSIRVRSGASGGPVFDESGYVVGVNSRGWDFDGGEHEGDELSSIVPLSEALVLGLDNLRLPRASSEIAQMPPTTIGAYWTLKGLAQIGHVDMQAITTGADW